MPRRSDPELIKDRAISKVHWGASVEEAREWLGSEGIHGREAEEILATAWRHRQNEIRKQAIWILIASGLGILVSFFAFLRVWNRWPVSTRSEGDALGLGIVLGVFSLYWFVVGWARLLKGRKFGPVD